MPDPNPQEVAAKAAAEAKAKADADAKAKASASDKSEVASLTESLKNLEQRTRLGAPAGPTPDMDVTIPGGKYIVKGKTVNAHGREIKDDGTLVHPEQQQVDAFGRFV